MASMNQLPIRASDPLGTQSARCGLMFLARRGGVLLISIILGATQLVSANPFPLKGPTVPGRFARLRHGVACAPEKAPLVVKRAIWAANQLTKRPYRYGGGHCSFYDSGYDCSGTISYALAGAGLLRVPLNSSDLLHYGKSGRGKWITVYARNGHAFAIIAGLRLDTTAWTNNYAPDAPRWRTSGRPPRGFVKRHPVGL